MTIQLFVLAETPGPDYGQALPGANRSVRAGLRGRSRAHRAAVARKGYLAPLLLGVFVPNHPADEESIEAV